MSPARSRQPSPPPARRAVRPPGRGVPRRPRHDRPRRYGTGAPNSAKAWNREPISPKSFGLPLINITSRPAAPSPAPPMSAVMKRRSLPDGPRRPPPPPCRLRWATAGGVTDEPARFHAPISASSTPAANTGAAQPVRDLMHGERAAPRPPETRMDAAIVADGPALRPRRAGRRWSVARIPMATCRSIEAVALLNHCRRGMTRPRTVRRTPWPPGAAR